MAARPILAVSQRETAKVARSTEPTVDMTLPSAPTACPSAPPVDTVESLCARISAHLDNAARQHKLMVDAADFVEYTSHREGMRVSLYMAGNLQRAVARRLTSSEVWK